MTSSERRRKPRVQANFPIQLASRDDKAQPPGAAILRDVSEIGLRCVYSNPIEEMTQVRIGLQLPGQSSVIDIQGAIVRCDKIADQADTENAWDIAIYFTTLPGGAAQQLGGWIHQQQAASNEIASRESGA